MEQSAGSMRPPEGPLIGWVLRPFQRFSREEAAGGIVLLVCAVLALGWANSPWSESYQDLWETHLRIGVGTFVLDETLHFWINDGLMAVFFFVVGLEIKRELLVGELASPRRAVLPAMAALGGMAVPALLYTVLNVGTDGARGWGIPMATDIAFSVGVLAVLGSRAPFTLKVFLTAFAIVDDIGAVIIIALFYTEEVAWLNVTIGGGFLLLLVLADRLGIRHTLVYGVLGIIVWLAFLQSGIHATVAGVLVAMTIPSRVRIGVDDFVAKERVLLDEFERTGEHGSRVQTSEDQSAVIRELESTSKDVESTLQRLEYDLNPWVAFVIVPLFALANAGIPLGNISLGGVLAQPVTLGVLLGLVLGKQLGITLFVWLAIRSGLAAMPHGMSWRHVYGAAWLGGIGFTMSIFFTGLAFTDPTLISQAKVAILIASVISGVGGWTLLRKAQPARAVEQATVS